MPSKGNTCQEPTELYDQRTEEAPVLAGIQKRHLFADHTTLLALHIHAICQAATIQCTWVRGQADGWEEDTTRSQRLASTAESV